MLPRNLQNKIAWQGKHRGLDWLETSEKNKERVISQQEADGGYLHDVVYLPDDLLRSLHRLCIAEAAKDEGVHVQVTRYCLVLRAQLRIIQQIFVLAQQPPLDTKRTVNGRDVINIELYFIAIRKLYIF